MFYVYVLQNPGGILYKGHTRDLDKRLLEHNTIEGFRRYTKRKGPWIIVYREEFSTRAEAMNREKFLKSGKGREFLSSIIGAPH